MSQYMSIIYVTFALPLDSFHVICRTQKFEEKDESTGNSVLGNSIVHFVYLIVLSTQICLHNAKKPK